MSPWRTNETSFSFSFLKTQKSGLTFLVKLLWTTSACLCVETEPCGACAYEGAVWAAESLSDLGVNHPV